MQGIISAVRRNSLAENAGIKAGEKLCAVNGVSVHDIIELTVNSLNSFNSIILCSIADYKPIKHNELDLSGLVDQIQSRILAPQPAGRA